MNMVCEVCGNNWRLLEAHVIRSVETKKDGTAEQVARAHCPACGAVKRLEPEWSMAKEESR
jgi:DNA-directed RNA polymerase subunit M/transcription elongation factor TFIIS